MRWLWPILVAAGPVACAPETRLTEDTFFVDPPVLDPCMILERDRINFSAEIGGSDRFPLMIGNACEGLLELKTFTFDDATTSFEVDEPRDLTVPRGIDVQADIRFEPLVAGRFTDRLFIETNDPELPVAEVVLVGETR